MREATMKVQQRIGIGAAVFGAALTLSSLVAGGASAIVANPVEVSGNVTTCAQVGYPGSTKLDGSITSGSGGNSLISYTVTDNKYVTLTSVDPSVTIQVVVVKGGDNYHLYNPPVVDMRSPLNGGGNVPDLSHWYLCYTVATTTTTAEVTTTTAEVTTTTAEVTTTTAEVTTTTAEVTTTTAEVTTTTAETTTTIVDGNGPTTTVAEETTTTLVDSEGPTTTLVDSEGPTTTAPSGGGGSLPTTGAGADMMLVFGLGLVVAGVVFTALGRRTDHI